MDIHNFTSLNYRFLSNFWPAEVEFDGTVYPSVENAYQAAKVLAKHRHNFTGCGPSAAKKLGRMYPMRNDWEEVKVSVMRDLIRQKFKPGSELSDRLLDTGDWLLEEGNTWGDTFWGVCDGVGENWLGRLLMERRGELRG